MDLRLSVTALAMVLWAACSTTAAFAEEGEAASAEHGRYLVTIAGCNDCHTSGYLVSEGQVPESEWLKGDSFGWNGPWGTTFAANLRISLSRMTEEQWVAFAKNLKARPPMPSVNLRQMTESDLKSIYAYVTSLQPLGEPAPEYLPPGVEPQGPHAIFPGEGSAH